MNLNVNIEARMRHGWSIKFGAWVMKLGAKIASATRAEYRVGNEPWRPIGRIKVGIKLELED